MTISRDLYQIYNEGDLSFNSRGVQELLLSFQKEFLIDRGIQLEAYQRIEKIELNMISGVSERDLVVGMKLTCEESSLIFTQYIRSRQNLSLTLVLMVTERKHVNRLEGEVFQIDPTMQEHLLFQQVHMLKVLPDPQ